MDQIQGVSQSIPHLVQVYQHSVSSEKIQNPQIIHLTQAPHPTTQEKITFQQTITSESQHIPATTDIKELQVLQSQFVMSCQPAQLQNLHQSQVLQSSMTSQLLQSDIGQQLQIASHMILPQLPVFKQHMLLSGVQQQYFRQLETYPKEESIITKEVESQAKGEMQIDCKSESTVETNQETPAKNMRIRSQIPNPAMWACNVRKLKHQRGEAYISRRGKYVSEKRVQNTKDCLRTCMFKCNERISDMDREHIFKAFYSLNANEKKHFLLNTTERNHIKHSKISDVKHKRKYSFKYFFLVRGVKYVVCKNFYLGTLSISQKPVYNVHLGKSDMNIPKPDGRGLSEASTHPLPSELKDRVRKHIMSFKTVDSKLVKQFSKKKQYLESSLSIKRMYTMYCEDCSQENMATVKESMYRKILKQEFNLHFRKTKSDQQLCCRCKGAIKKK